MVLSFKLYAAFVGPDVCLSLGDNDIMAEESTQTDNSAQLWGDNHRTWSFVTKEQI